MEDLNKRYQTMFTLWFALFASVGLYFAMTLFAAPPLRTEPLTRNESLGIAGLTIVGALFVAVSFWVKKRFLDRAAEQQSLPLVQQGFIIAMALCEVSALLGLLERFVFANRESYALFLIAAGGQMLHFPKRSHLEAATYKTNQF
jgi:hypothetical protein